MPGSKLNKSDIFDDSFFQALGQADKELKTLLKTFQELAKQAKEVSKGVSAAKSFNEVTKAAKKASEATTKLTAEEKKLERATKELAFQQSDAGKKLASINHEKNKAAKANRDLAKSQDAAKKSTNNWANAVKSFQFKFNALGNVVANFASVALRKLKQGLVATFNIVANFDQAMADVKAVTNASKKEMDALTKSAQKLGGTTKFTATQVAQLQKEYAKLGFTTKEILNAQAATLDLAAATNTELARAAEVVGITLKQFKLSAEETTRVTDVMAKSFSTSALDMEKFAESMKFVGPAARASGISVERTTAMLGQLADAGISGSMAGTSLRQIMLALSKESGTFAEKLERAADKGLDLAGASEEVQKRAATSLLVLADGIDTIDEYTEALEDAAGASQAMADVQLDTLQGKITIVKSAWEGMILAMLNTEENLSGVKWALQGIITLLNAMALRADTVIEGKHGKKRLSLSEAFAIEKTTQDLADWAIELDKSNKSLDEFLGFFEKGAAKDAFKGLGKDLLNTLFPNPEEVAIQFDDVTKQLKAIKKDQTSAFKDEDQDYVQAHEEAFSTIESATKGVFETLETLVQHNTDLDIEHLDIRTQAENKFLEERLKAEELLRDTKIAAADQAFNFVSTLYDRQLEKIERQEQAGVISAEKAEEEKNRIRRRAAVVDKAQALFQIGLNTAMGITNAAAKTVTIPLIPWITALGLTQAATVIATPVPQFEKGTDSAPGGLAVVGEKGTELMVGPDGRIGLTPANESLMNVDKGTKIFPADVTSEIMKYAFVASGLGSRSNDSNLVIDMMERIDKSNERLRRELKNKPVASSTITPAGILAATHKGSTIIKRLDKFYK